MDKKRHAHLITRRLAKAYPNAHVTLYYHTPFQLVVSVILSAQATDKRVNEVMAPQYKKYKTAKDFAALSVMQIEKMVRPLGFYRSKAKAVYETAKRVRDVYGNHVPKDFDELLTLRGVARKSANVIYGVLTGEAKGIVVDTHVTRLAQRLGLTRESDAVRIERDLMAVLSKEHWRMFPHRLVAHGRAVCTARRPRCNACPLCDICPSAFTFSPWIKPNKATKR